jgi:ABC-type bacteriocin/lantibiotic exporter with double-glycine peptidase domain
MKLSVPIITADESQLYATVVVEMVLKYYGKTTERSMIESFLDERHGGTDIVQIGRFFVQQGFGAEIITLHPRLFTMQHCGFSQEQVHEHINHLIEFHMQKRHDQIALQHVLTYMQEGGVVTPGVPDFDRVKKELDRERPVIALLPTTFTAGGSSNMDFHFVVITGYSGKYIYINDSKTMDGAQKKIRENFFFRGIYAQFKEQVDEGCLLMIRP